MTSANAHDMQHRTCHDNAFHFDTAHSTAIFPKSLHIPISLHLMPTDSRFQHALDHRIELPHASRILA
jgi:hypothetical protein